MAKSSRGATAGHEMTLRLAATFLVFLTTIIVMAQSWQSKFADQSWQRLEKRGTHAAKSFSDCVSYADLDATYDAIKQYEGMQDVVTAQSDERQKQILKRLDTLEEAKIDTRLTALETIVNENQVWIRGIGIGFVGTFLAVAFNTILHVREKAGKK